MYPSPSARPDEWALWVQLHRMAEGAARKSPGREVMLDVARDIGMAPKRLCYILSKWCDRGLWDFGVNILHGWFTDDVRAPEIA